MSHEPTKLRPARKGADPLRLARASTVLALLGALAGGGAASAAPLGPAQDTTWVSAGLQVAEVTDCFGDPAQTDTAEDLPCQTYNGDLYESLEYMGISEEPADDSDIQVFRVGADATFLYVEWDMAAPWDIDTSPSHHYVIEVDVDPSVEARRGDDYVAIFGKSEFNSTSWVDAFLQGGYTAYADNANGGTRNDVGGPDPETGDPSCSGCPDPAGGQDGYSGPITQQSGQVFARVISGNVQMAVRWTYLQNSVANGNENQTLSGRPTFFAVRGWISQSSSLEQDQLYWHDEHPTTDLPTERFDNVGWLGQSLAIAKTLTSADPTVVGANVTFSIVVTNYTNGRLTSVTVDDVFDTAYLDFVTASITPAAVNEGAGTIQWTGLEASAPGGQFDEGESITITVTFLATAATPDPVRAVNAASVTARPFGSQDADDFIEAGPVQDDVEIDPLLAVQLERFEARRAGRAVSVEWSTVSEIKSAGFRVWRETPAGLQRVGPELLPARGGELGGAAYRAIDWSAPNGATRYWLDEVGTTGEITRYGPAMAPARRARPVDPHAVAPPGGAATFAQAHDAEEIR